MTRVAWAAWTHKISSLNCLVEDRVVSSEVVVEVAVVNLKALARARILFTAFMLLSRICTRAKPPNWRLHGMFCALSAGGKEARKVQLKAVVVAMDVVCALWFVN